MFEVVVATHSESSLQSDGAEVGISDGTLETEGWWLNALVGPEEGTVEGMLDGDADGSGNKCWPPPHLQQACLGPFPKFMYASKKLHSISLENTEQSIGGCTTCHLESSWHWVGAVEDGRRDGD